MEPLTALIAVTAILAFTAVEITEIKAQNRATEQVSTAQTQTKPVVEKQPVSRQEPRPLFEDENFTKKIILEQK